MTRLSLSSEMYLDGLESAESAELPLFPSLHKKPSRTYFSTLKHLARCSASSSIASHGYNLRYNLSRGNEQEGKFDDDDDADDNDVKNRNDDNTVPSPRVEDDDWSTISSLTKDQSLDSRCGNTAHGRSGRLLTQSASSSALAAPKHTTEKVFSDGISKSSIDWVELRARQVPGVGAHDLNASYRSLHSTGSPRRTGETLNYDLKSRWHRWDQQLAEDATLPGPGHFDDDGGSGASRGVAGGKISAGALPPTPLDLAIRRAALLPGPQDYNPTDPTAARGGGKFAESTAKSDLEWTLHHAKEIPGPGECKRAMLGTVFSNRAIKAHPIFLWHSLSRSTCTLRQMTRQQVAVPKAVDGSTYRSPRASSSGPSGAQSR
jgi:hypothetical protein